MNHIAIQRCLLIFITLITFFQVWYINNTPWSPIDEYQHMDYIDNIASGKMPSISDSISEELFIEIIHHSDQNPAKRPPYREALGLTGYSYQAKHPPLYYLLLAAPDRLMQAWDFTIFKRLQILRTVSFSIFFIGLFLMLLIGKEMRKQGHYLPTTYILIGIAWCLFTVSHERYGLGNNYLSPLLINSSILALLTFIKSPKPKHLFLLTFLAGLSICGALTNLFILPILFVLALPSLIRAFDWKLILAGAAGLIIPLVIIVLWKLNSIPEPIVASNINSLLQNYFRANMVSYGKFLHLFINDFFKIDFLGNAFNLTVLHICLALSNVLLMLFFFFSNKDKDTRWLYYTYPIFIYFLILLGLLNHYIDAVTWVAFRHYMGFYPFLFIGISSGFLILFKNLKPKNSN